jgi:hypothetical protein
MTDRKLHPDIEMIDKVEQVAIEPTQQGSSGGDVARTVRSRAELHDAVGQLEAEEVERATVRDNPKQNDRMGAKAHDKIGTGHQNG